MGQGPDGAQAEGGTIVTNGAADLLFVNGAVYTVDAARSWAEAVAVRVGRIVAVGSNDDVAGFRGSSTEIVDLGGRMLVPGFQDAHVHPVNGGLDALRCDLSGDHGLDAYLDRIRAYVSSHPDVPWILGGGWSMDVFPGGNPRAETLDALIADRPAFLPNRDGHGAWVNSRALEVAGITKDTPDPYDGRIERDADGTPTGSLHEGAMDLVVPLVPEPTHQEMIDALLKAQGYLHSLGITAWQDALVDSQQWGWNLPAYIETARDGRLTARVVGALWWERHQGEEQVEELIGKRAQAEGLERFRARSVKIMQDGVIENFTAAMIEPYLDADGNPTDHRGPSLVEPEALKSAVTRLDAVGFQVHFHCIGDRSVREALDAIEAARRANGPNDHRHHISHIEVIHPDDIPRFRTLRVVANAQPLWALHEGQMDDLTIPFLGEPRWRWLYPFASLVRAGAVLAMGSDWFVSSPDPIEQIHVAVNRKAAPNYQYGNGNDEVFLPEERLDLPTALAAFTMGSAYVNHLDGGTGSIEVGKAADLAVIDRDLFAHPVAEIASAQVEQTFVAGLRVYAAPDAG
ncbi:MAG TPA: amidohydrolase [Actinomycetota bacterium]